ncbi:MAG TPA: glycosyltransferase [Patescibacteria group bacterium]|nr:glycosyltransferase [Patescibacteria group bacterium]
MLFRSLGPLSGKEILDVGCGEAELSTQLARLGASVTGVDISPELVEVARQRAVADGVRDILETPLPEERFDLAACSAVLRHGNERMRAEPVMSAPVGRQGGEQPLHLTAHERAERRTVVSIIALNPQKWGSLEEQTMFLSMALRNRGWRSVLLFDREPKGAVLAKLKETGATIGALPHRDSATFYPALVLALRRAQPSIVHFRLCNSFSVLPIAAWLSGARAIFFTEETHRPGTTARSTRAKCYAWDRVVLRGLGVRIVTVSDYVKRVLTKTYRVSPERVQVLLHGVNTERFRPSEDLAIMDMRRECGIPAGEQVIVCAAHLIPEKGVESLLHAAQQILQARRDVSLLIVGEGPLGSKLRQVAQNLGISGKVHFLGLRSDVHRLFAMADVVAVPSAWEEPAGLVLLEAMATGRPVVATRVGGIPEYLEDGKAGILVDRDSPTQLAQALLSLLDTPTLATAMGCAARRGAEARFTVERWASETLSMYEAALSQG